MSRDLLSIKKEICEAGLRLVKEGLVARSWGNISMRVDDRRMAVTPSGIRYEDVRPEHITIVDLTDGSYQSSVKPSGERKLHIAIYRVRPDIGAVIHTHQMNASVCAAVRVQVPVSSAASKKILGTSVIGCGAYGLPGTGKLTKETVSAIKDGRCALMANHGAVCLGSDLADAFAVAKTLEAECGQFIYNRFGEETGVRTVSDESMIAHYLREHGVA